MKKTTALLLIVLLLLCACACGNADTPSENQGEPASEPAADAAGSTDGGAEETAGFVPLLEGYPEDVLPLYESTGITGCGFIYRDDPNFVIGKDLYTVSYASDASLEEISEYYQSLLTYMDEYSEEDFLQGDIGDHHVLVSINDAYDDDFRHVDMSIGLAEDEYVDENPFFADLPGGLVEISGMIRLQEASYLTSIYSADEVRYLTVYETDLTEEDFAAFYQEKYGKIPGFSEDRDDYGLTYAWEDRGYACHVTYSPNNYTFVTVEINPIEE